MFGLYDFFRDDQLCLFDGGEGYCFLHVFDGDQDVVALGAFQGALETLAAIEGGLDLQPCFLTGEAVEIFKTGEGPVDARRADFKVIGRVFHGVLDVQHDRDGLAQFTALINRDCTIRFFSHDLQCWLAAADQDNAHEFKPHRFDGRGYGAFNLFNNRRFGHFFKFGLINL